MVVPVGAAGGVTDVEVLSAHVGFRNLLFVRVHTESGLTGVGEATLEWHDEPVAAAIKDLAHRYVIHQPANRIEDVWQAMLRGSFWRGGPTHLTAISAINQALWDIKGKVADLPVYDLLGGPCRDHVELYANGPRGESPDEYAESARQLVRAGYRAMKTSAVPATRLADAGISLDHTVEVMEALRAAIGPDIRLAIDFHGRLSPAMAIRCARRLEALDVWFIEEPTLPNNWHALPQIAASTEIPLASGERWFTLAEFDGPIRDGGLAIVQPDVTHCGGISELRRIAAVAESRQIALAPHNPLGPIATAAAAHVAMTTPNFLALEAAHGDAGDWTATLIRSAHRITNGKLELSADPGLGVELNDDVIAAHPPKPLDAPGWRHADGSVAEW